MLELRTDYLKVVNYALIHNRFKVIQTVELVNDTPDDLRNLYVECSGEFATPVQSACLAEVKAGSTIRLQDFDLRLSAVKLATITERLQTSFSIVITSGAPGQEARQELWRKDYELELMPYDQWLGTTIMPQSVASFVLPNNPLVGGIVVKAAAILKELSGTSSFTEYQSGNPNEVVRQVAAIYGALHGEGLVYRSLPASFETVGQRVTLPDQVIAGKLGNCVELTILFASVLESVGINSCIVLQRGHAYLAVWLVDDCCQYSLCDDPAFIEKKCSKGIDEMMVLECTGVTQETTSFEQAVQIAQKNLANLSLFEQSIDIRRCRLERIYPLPQRVMREGNWELDVKEGVQHDECVIDVQERSRYDLTKLIAGDRQLSRMDIWERKLLDFSLRNSMLNLYLRQKAIQFVSFDIHLLEDMLQDGEEYLIGAKPNVEFTMPENERLMRSKLLPELRELISNDIKHHLLHTYYTEQETAYTLKNIYRSARSAIEENGANSLYLAIGTLRWFETDQSEQPRYAPLLLLPVEMVYKKGGYYIRTREEEIALNVTLTEFLRQNFDITIPGLSPLPMDEHGVDVPLIFAAIRDALKDRKRWDVEEEALLGVFSFSKYLMWNDIHNHRDQLLGHDIVRSLVEQKLAWTPAPLTTNLRNNDKQFRPEQFALPVAVDSSQMAAVLEAGQGHSFILYGPPGTGKSQTITNLIANALYQGKRVLFVAQKMAALSVVEKRLDKIGLGPFCLEMHSNKLAKSHVLGQLASALGVTHIMSPRDYQSMAEQLYEQRMKLIQYMEALHENHGDNEFSLYDCILQFEQIDAEVLKLSMLDAQLKSHFTPQSLDEVRHLTGRRLTAVVALTGQPSAHPLLGLDIQESDLGNIQSLTADMSKAKEQLGTCRADYAVLQKVKEERQRLLQDNKEEFLELDAAPLYDEWRRIKTKWFLPKFFAVRSFLSKARDYNPYIREEQVDGWLESQMAYQKLHRRIVSLQETLAKYFHIKLGVDEMPSSEHIDNYVAMLSRWMENIGQSGDWYQWCAYKKEMNDKGLGSLVDYMEQHTFVPVEMENSFLKTVFMNMAQEKIGTSSMLRTFEGSIFDETVARYKKLTDDFQLLSQKELYAKLAAQIPHVSDNINSSSEIGLLNRNISNGGRGLSLRDLLDQIPNLLPRLCPCMLMSPMSVAQYLDLTQEKFDLVIFDEASQMPTSEAVGAIARGKSLVVVGDPKQMPPTSFFNSTNTNDEEAEIDDMESILEDCRTLEIPSLQLNWHYRSRHESLIAFSNNEYYDGSLITFPSVDDRESRVSFVPIEGVYDKGGRRSNQKEAEAIVAEIVKLLKADDHSEKSIGVIAFSVVQQNLIEDLLQEKLESDTKLREAADSIYEPIFVKNLENVQGDERDIILFSIGYGPDKEGKVSMNFGPLNNSGGERRLNVAVSRARQQMMVFSSLRASQIDLRRSKAKGVEGLKHFLEYAEQQVLIQTESSAKQHKDTIIAQQIAKALTDRGHRVTVNVGRSNFKVDVAVSSKEDESVYSLGLLLDGAGYYATQTTRDREIVQPTVLEGLKWQIMRVWSVDWLNHPERVIARIEQKLATEPKTEPKIRKQEFDISNEEVEEKSSREVEYVNYEPAGRVDKLSDQRLIRDIVAVEQPITPKYLCRRICAVRELARTTPTMLADVQSMAEAALYVTDDENGKTIWTDFQTCESYHTYRKSCGRDVSDIPLIELLNATVEALTEQLSIDRANLSLIVAKKMGFSRRGAKVDAVINLAIEKLIADRKIELANDKLTLRTQ